MDNSENLKEGTRLVPKPEWEDQYEPGRVHIVTKKEEELNATIGERWMILEDK